MSQQYFTLLTQVGRQKLHAAVSQGETLHLSHMAVGDGGGNPISPNDGMTSLVNEVYRAPITDKTADATNPTWAVFNLVIPVDAGGWYVREAGLYDVDGDLIFVGSLPENYKALPTQGIASDLAINMVVDIQRADSVTVTVDPSLVLASRSWVAETIETRMMEHDADPDAHAEMVTALKASGDLIGRDEVDQMVGESVDAAIFGSQGRIRERRQEDLTIYVRTDGDDAHDGLTEATAKQTITAARSALNRFDFGDYRAVIDIGPGEYSETLNHGSPVAVSTSQDGNPSLSYRGSGKDVTILTSAISIGCGLIFFDNLTLADELRVVDSGSARLTNVKMRGTGKRALAVYRGGVISIMDNNSELEGNFTYVCQARYGGIITFGVASLSISGPLTCINFMRATEAGSISMLGTITNPERVTGSKWYTARGGMLCLDGDADTVLPGTINGSSGMTATAAIQASGSRRLLDSVLTIYVRTEGDDAHDGLTEATAKKTITAARSALNHYELGDHRAIIDIGPGEFSETLSHSSPVAVSTSQNGNPSLCYRGAGKDVTILTSAISIGCGLITFTNMTLAHELKVMDNSSVRLTNFKIRGTGVRGLVAYRGGLISIADNNIEFEGDFNYVCQARYGGIITSGDATLNISGPLTCNNFMRATEAGSITMLGTITNPEQVTGTKWYVARGGALCLNQDPDTVLPGTINGRIGMPAMAAIQSVTGEYSASGSRRLLDSVLTIYVRTEGDDANDGLSEGTAKASLRGALDALSLFDVGHTSAVIQMGEGEFQTPGVLSGPLVTSSATATCPVWIKGAGKDRTIVNGRLFLYGVPPLKISDLHHKGELNVYSNSTVWLYSVRFTGKDDTPLLQAIQGGVVFIRDDGMEFEGNCQSVLRAAQCGVLAAQNVTMTISGELNCSYFAHARLNGSLSLSNCTFTNSERVQGKKWRSDFGGQVCLYGQNPDDALPGTESGQAV